MAKVDYVNEGGVVTITIDNAPMNPLNKAIIDGIRDAFNKVRDDESARCVILTGAGDKAFVAGADIKEFSSWTPQDAEDFTEKGQRIFLHLIERCPVPVIAAIGGFALGGGLELALACDFRIASTKATLGLVEVTLGIIPGYGGSQRLMRTIGIGRAKQMIFAAEMVNAEEALRIGLVSQVVEPDQLMDTCKKIAGKIAKNAPIAVRTCKELMEKGRDTTIEEGLYHELWGAKKCFSTKDKIEGVDAFINKRKAEFKNH